MAILYPYSDAVAQASGMVSVQAVCDIPQAIAFMEDIAVATDTLLEEIAAMVIEGEIRFGA